jgi:hypothetical protein
MYFETSDTFQKYAKWGDFDGFPSMWVGVISVGQQLSAVVASKVGVCPKVGLSAWGARPEQWGGMRGGNFPENISAKTHYDLKFC